MREISPLEIGENIIRLIGREWMLLTAGNAESYNTMTASWGGAGELWNRHVAFVFVREQRYTYRFMEEQTRFTLSFFDETWRPALSWCGAHSGREGDKFAAAGLTPLFTADGVPAVAQARMVLQCRKLYADMLREEAFVDRALVGECYPEGDFHKVYVAEIEHVWVKA